MQFEFTSAGRIIFGPGVRSQAAAIVRQFGSRAFVVTGADSSRASWLLRELSEPATWSASGEPTLDSIREAVRQARANNPNIVVGIGGGSALDAAKAIAALVPNSGEPLDYLEVVGKGQQLENPPIPVVAIPTTAGTGSEVTKNAVIGDPERRVKASLRSASMLPKVAIVDPELTRDLPPALTASTGMDALTQLIEPYVSIRANPLTDGLAQEGVRRAAQSLRRAYTDGADLNARTEMSLAAVMAGLCLANAGLGVVHGCAAPLGAMFSAPHGAICAALLPQGIRANIRALQQRDPDGIALRRYATLARLVTGQQSAAPERLGDWVDGLRRALNIPPLGFYGVMRQHLPEIAALAKNASSMKANPIELSDAEIVGLLTPAL